MSQEEPNQILFYLTRGYEAVGVVMEGGWTEGGRREACGCGVGLVRGEGLKYKRDKKTGNG